MRKKLKHRSKKKYTKRYMFIDKFDYGKRHRRGNFNIFSYVDKAEATQWTGDINVPLICIFTCSKSRRQGEGYGECFGSIRDFSEFKTPKTDSHFKHPDDIISGIKIHID